MFYDYMFYDYMFYDSFAFAVSIDCNRNNISLCLFNISNKISLISLEASDDDGVFLTSA